MIVECKRVLTATTKDATIACTCTSAILPITILKISRRVVIFPKLACVDRREARHMSKFPLRPSRAGTSINNPRISSNTIHCCNGNFLFLSILKILKRKHGIFFKLVYKVCRAVSDSQKYQIMTDGMR